MEAKKNPRVDYLEAKSGVFLNLGIVVSLLICCIAFEWKSYDDGNLINLGAAETTFEENLEVQATQQPPPPPPPVIKQPEIVEVPDEVEVEEKAAKIDVEVATETVVEEQIFEKPVEEEVVEEVFTIVEDQPLPTGGMQAFYTFIGENMTYPNQARRMAIEGKVFVQFVIDKDGSITEVQAVKGIGAGCDEEAVRVIKNAPKWKPGKQRGRPVKVRMILPITFKLH